MTRMKDRHDFVAGLPWVTRLKKPQERCDGIKWGTVALRDLYPYRGLPARGIQERSRCKMKGWWRFRALRQRGYWAMPATSGTYCWNHLMVQMNQSDAEITRVAKAWRERS